MLLLMFVDGRGLARDNLVVYTYSDLDTDLAPRAENNRCTPESSLFDIHHRTHPPGRQQPQKLPSNWALVRTIRHMPKSALNTGLRKQMQPHCHAPAQAQPTICVRRRSHHEHASMHGKLDLARQMGLACTPTNNEPVLLGRTLAGTNSEKDLPTNSFCCPRSACYCCINSEVGPASCTAVCSISFSCEEGM